MTDVSHELGALRFVVDSPLSSKVAMFNNQATQHKQSQLLNPFSESGASSRASSPKPTFSKDEYGKPLAGSLTEMRGQKANMHVMKEMLELCQIISSEGYVVKDEPTMRVIPFGELFNIYNYISDKVVGILLRARKHKLVEFEGEMLFQRRDDDVPVFLLRPILEIRRELEAKIDEIKRGASPAPQSTSVLLDRSAHEQKLKVQTKSRTPSPAVKSKSASPAPAPVAAAAAAVAAPVAAASVEQKPPVAPAAAKPPVAATSPVPAVAVEQPPPAAESPAPAAAPAAAATEPEPASAPKVEAVPAPATEVAAAVAPDNETATAVAATAAVEAVAAAAAEPTVVAASSAASQELPTIVIEASAVYMRKPSIDVPSTEDGANGAAVASGSS